VTKCQALHDGADQVAAVTKPCLAPGTSSAWVSVDLDEFAAGQQLDSATGQADAGFYGIVHHVARTEILVAGDRYFRTR
jgi:hypothetical protein